MVMREREVFAEQISAVVRLGIPGGIAALVVAALYMVMVWPHNPQGGLIAWYAVLGTLSTGRIIAGLHMQRRALAAEQARGWAAAVFMLALLSGLCWGVAASVLFPFGQADLYLVAMVLLIGMPAGAIASIGIWLPAYAAFAASAILPFAAAVYLTNGPGSNITAVGVFVYLFFLAGISRWLQRMMRDNIAGRIEKEDMARDIAAARDAAEAASRAKSSFLANMSHEIRTPLNAVIGTSELLLDTTLNDRQRHYAGIIRRASASLLDIINDVLDMSRIEAGRLELHPAAFDPRAIFDEVRHMFQPEADRKKLAFSVVVDAAIPQSLVGDKPRLRQILVNLVGNALKFTEQGSVAITADRAEAAQDACVLRISVADTGIGISEQQQQRLFQPFSQADDSGTRKYGGSGLGLRISLDLVQLMGGNIEVTSSPGAGSVFRLTLRLGVAAAAPVQLQPDGLPPVPAGAHVLLVEDNAVNQMVAQAMLDSLGCVVQVAADGMQALAALAAEKFDLVLMDCQMPNMDGFEAVRRLREMEQGSGGRIPVIALTANALTGDRERCLAAGMDDHLGKPIVRAQLQRCLGTWLRASPLRRDSAR